tara:strand:+ start:231 stop:770 length:540 start_codon:yes stop_codon:yes gene_type:complete
MLLISQNLAKYDMVFPEETIFRINLAWVNNIQELIDILKKHENHPLFLDLPVGRLKPPDNKYTLEDLITILRSYEQIKYFAVSNVTSSNDISKYVELLPKNIIIVPKIENPSSIDNMEEITEALQGTEKIVMLDHDDLYSSLVKMNNSTKFQSYVKKLVDFCKKNNITLLRARGIIFSD